MDIQKLSFPITEELIEKGFILSIDEENGVFELPSKKRESIHEWSYIKVYLDKILYYDGLFFQEEKNGFGIEYYPEKGYYRGEFQDGRRHGNGHLFYNDGTNYKGNFMNDMFHGYGEYFNKNGSDFINRQSLSNIYIRNGIAYFFSNKAILKYNKIQRIQ